MNPRVIPYYVVVSTSHFQSMALKPYRKMEDNYHGEGSNK